MISARLLPKADVNSDATKGDIVMTRGEKVCAFIEQYCLIPEGAEVGQPILTLKLLEARNYKTLLGTESSTRRSLTQKLTASSY